MKTRRPGASQFVNPPAFTPKALHQVSRLAVPCPECDAPVGVKCTTATGKVLEASHRCRVRIATRKYNEKRTAETTSNLPDGPVE